MTDTSSLVVSAIGPYINQVIKGLFHLKNKKPLGLPKTFKRHPVVHVLRNQAQFSLPYNFDIASNLYKANLENVQNFELIIPKLVIRHTFRPYSHATMESHQGRTKKFWDPRQQTFWGPVYMHALTSCRYLPYWYLSRVRFVKIEAGGRKLM